jgi:hypothetical protein
MVVSAVANLAVIAEIDRRRRGDGGGSREADDGAVTLRRGTIHREGSAGRPGESRRDRPAGVGELVLPAQAKGEVDLTFIGKPDGAAQVGAQKSIPRARKRL